MRIPYIDLAVYRANDATFRFIFEDANSTVPRTPHVFPEDSRFVFTAKRDSRYPGRPDTSTNQLQQIVKDSAENDPSNPSIVYVPEARSLYLYLVAEDTEAVTRNERYDFECDVFTSETGTPRRKRQTVFRGVLEVRHTENLNGVYPDGVYPDDPNSSEGGI